MRYELYVDSLFLINFVMNLYILMLIDRSTLRTATPGRLLAGASVGAGGYLLLFLIGGPVPLKLLLGVSGALGMLLIAFPVKGFRNFLRLAERAFVFSFCIAGGLLFFIRSLHLTEGLMTGFFGIMGLGGGVFLFLGHSLSESREESCVCRATLVRQGNQVTVSALLDSGNSLVEPISGKPVSVVEEKIFRTLWNKNGSGQDFMGYRAIPFHSIGKSRGILEGYLLQELQLEVNGMHKIFYDVYIAVTQECISVNGHEADSIKMIVNPRLLAEEKRGKPKKRQNVRIYDTESGNTGKNAV